MGLQGKITATDIIDAFKKAKDELEAQFAKTVPTIGQSFTVLRNKVIEVIGAFNKGTGVLRILSGAILFLAANIETILRLLGALVILMSGSLIIKGVGAALRGFSALSKAWKTGAGRLRVMGGAIGIVASLLAAFGDQIFLNSKKSITVLDALGVAWDIMKDAAVTAIDTVGGLVNANTDLLKDYTFEWEDVIRITLQFAQVIPAIIGGVLDAVSKNLLQLPQAIGGAIINGLNATLRGVHAFAVKIKEVLGSVGDKLFPNLAEEAPQIENQFKDAGTNFTDAFLDGFKARLNSGLVALFDEVMKRAGIKAQERMKRLREEQAEIEKALNELLARGEDKTKRDAEKQAFLDAIRSLKEEATLLGLTNKERENQSRLLDIVNSLRSRGIDLDSRANAGLRARILSMIENNQALSDQASMLDELREPMEKYIRMTAALEALWSDAKVSAEEYRKKLRDIKIELLEANDSGLAGVQRGLLNVAKEAENSGALMEEFVVGAFSKMEDAFLQFVKTGKLEFSSLVDSIIADLTRIAFKKAVIAPLANALFGALTPSVGGGETGDLGSSFATGGSFKVGGMGGTDSQMVGFRATPGEKVTISTPSQQANGGEGGMTINITQQISMPGGDADSINRSQDSIMARGLIAAQRAHRRNK